MYKKVQQSAEFLTQAFDGRSPEVALVLGSGLGPLAEELENQIAVPFGEIPHFRCSTAPDHAGRLVLGQLSGKTILCMQGRLHGYEGYTPEEVAYPILVLKALGAEAVILTNAAGGINTAFRAGDFMVFDDHINMTGKSPLTGANDEQVGPRFPDMCHVYPKSLRDLADVAAQQCNIKLHHGVYVGVNGPQYETAAEIRMFRALGGDAVGMSTVFESIAASYCRLPVLGISMITNMAAGITGDALSDEEVKQMANARGQTFRALIRKLIAIL